MNIHGASWPAEGLTRVPYWIYSDRDLYAEEQERIFRGDDLDLPVPRRGAAASQHVPGRRISATCRWSWRATRTASIHAFENRCAHRGALICLEGRGDARDFTCVYHAWNYDLSGNLNGVAFQRRHQRQGRHAGRTFQPRRPSARASCASQTSAGLVFGTLSDDVPPIEEYLGEEIAATHQARAAQAPVEAARPLHPDAAEQLEALFRERQGHLSREPAAHVLHDVPAQPAVAERRPGGERERRQPRQLLDVGRRAGKEYEQAGMRSAQDGFALEAPELLLDTSTSSATASTCRSSRCSRASCCSRSRTALAVRRSCRKG